MAQWQARQDAEELFEAMQVVRQPKVVVSEEVEEHLFEATGNLRPLPSYEKKENPVEQGPE